MKGLIFDIQNFCYQDGPGIRTTVFLKGCPLRCKWCHNPESQKFNQEPMQNEETGLVQICGNEKTSQEIFNEVIRDISFFQESGGGVTLSGGEPTSQPDFAYDILRRCKDARINTAMETCGYAPEEVLIKMLEVCDLFLYDVKLVNASKHMEYTGVDNTVILQNLQSLKNKGAEIIARMPLIPGVNDKDEFINILKFLKATEIFNFTFIPYHRIWHSKYRQLKRGKPYDFEELDMQQILHYKDIAKDFGMNIIT